MGQRNVLQSWVPLEGLNFLHSSHCKLSSTRQQYCLVPAGELWFPYISGAQDVRFCEDMVL
jgi:hypothetical protein